MIAETVALAFWLPFKSLCVPYSDKVKELQYTHTHTKANLHCLYIEPHISTSSAIKTNGKVTDNLKSSNSLLACSVNPPFIGNHY